MSCIDEYTHILEVHQGQLCNVYPFYDSYEPMENICMVNATFAYDTENKVILVLNINQSLDFSHNIVHALPSLHQWSPNQWSRHWWLPNTSDIAHTPSGFLHIQNSKSHYYMSSRKSSCKELNTCWSLDLTAHDHQQPELHNNMKSVAISAINKFKESHDFFSMLSKHCSQICCSIQYNLEIWQTMEYSFCQQPKIHWTL